MIDKKEFNAIEKELAAKDKIREQAIQDSRAIIKLSKEIIYAIHRDDLAHAEAKLKSIRAHIKKLNKDAETNMTSVAVQEFVEAALFFEFMNTRKLATLASFKADHVSTEEYLLGVCDFTGELVRRAVNESLKEHYDQVNTIKELVTEIYWAFMTFDLRNSELRKKSDQIKWNLNKIEDLTIDIHFKKKK